MELVLKWNVLPDNVEPPAVSPMLVDSSLHSQSEDASDFGTDVINVTEYAEEIHQYLREAEVSFSNFSFNSQHLKHSVLT